MTITLYLTDDEAYAITNDLRVAAERYTDHIKVMKEAGHPSLVKQFEKQRDGALKWASQIEGLICDDEEDEE